MISPVFIAHGSPMMALEDTAASRFLEELGGKLRPKAVVVFTAHWEDRELKLSSPDGPFETIYDFGGFSPELYAKKYPAPGWPELRSQLAQRFREAGIAVKETDRGLDHGSWVPLSRMYPEAHIPVVQISVNPNLSPEEHFRIGSVLRGLPEEDILVMGSGVTVHNLRRIEWGKPRDRAVEPWAAAFDDWLIEKLERHDLNALFSYEQQAPHAREAVPTPEHFVPLFIAAGSASPGSKPAVIHRSYEFGVLSYLSLQF
ncbi:MAG: dioxygenase [Paenibacillaceae bacterium]|jgi:4,5-DOPA dioxygenase extradiol|nr:dioxygenase [Paenibacillaceae bacterium]